MPQSVNPEVPTTTDPELSLQEMISAAEAALKGTAPEATEAPVEQPETPEQAEPESDSKPDTDVGETVIVEGDKQGSESSETPVLTAALAALDLMGYDVDGLDEETAKKYLIQLKERASQPAQPVQVVEEKKPETKPETVTLPPELAGKATGSETQHERRLKKLIVDRNLESLIEYEGGKAIPKDGYGADAVAAAQKMNEYLDAYRRRVTEMTEDPVDFLLPGVEGDDLKDRIEKLIEAKVEERLAGERKSREQETAQQAAEREAREENQRTLTFFETYKSEVYKLGPDGKPRILITPAGEEFALTDFGRLCKQEFEELQKISDKPTSVLLEQSYKNAKKYQPAAKPAETSEQKKKKFLADRGAPTVAPTASRTTASPTELAMAGTNLRDLILNDPANAELPILPELRA